MTFHTHFARLNVKVSCEDFDIGNAFYQIYVTMLPTNKTVNNNNNKNTNTFTH